MGEWTWQVYTLVNNLYKPFGCQLQSGFWRGNKPGECDDNCDIMYVAEFVHYLLMQYILKGCLFYGLIASRSIRSSSFNTNQALHLPV